MLLAKAGGGERKRAWPKGRARCPACAVEVIAKCGTIRVWHWAHRAHKDCDPWKERETAWHLEWKGRFPPECVESVSGPHRADVLVEGKAGRAVLEFQHSPISPEEIRAREDFWGVGDLMWVFDFTDKRDGFSFTPFENEDASGFPPSRFRWKRVPKQLLSARSRIYLDFGTGLIFRIRRINPEDPHEGWGQFRNRNVWVENIVGKYALDIQVPETAI